MANIIKSKFPRLADKLPAQEVENEGFPVGGMYTGDNSRSRKVLGVEYRGLEESITDLVRVLLEMGA